MEKDISLAEEIETAELYANIENIRFNNEIKIEVIIAPEIPIDTIRVPALMLQPFIENAIWHGLSSKKVNKSLWIRVLQNNNKTISVEIEDNGIGRKKAASLNKNKLHKKDSVGIKITEERLAKFTNTKGSTYKLVIEDLFTDNLATGTLVTIKIPLN